MPSTVKVTNFSPMRSASFNFLDHFFQGLLYLDLNGAGPARMRNGKLRAIDFPRLFLVAREAYLAREVVN